MAQGNAQHIRELAGLIKAPGITARQKEALILGIVALRKHYGDMGLERKSGATTDGVSEPAIGEPTSVYKYFDKAGILIYVGITGSGALRNRQHNESKEWWKFVRRQQVEHFKSRALAHEREVQLIERFKPPFNKQHNKDHAASRRFYLDMVEGRAPSLVQLQTKKSLSLQMT